LNKLQGQVKILTSYALPGLTSVSPSALHGF